VILEREAPEVTRYWLCAEARDTAWRHVHPDKLER
jgi:hypothetical protein